MTPNHSEQVPPAVERRPLFSVCIPNFNYGRYIGETIRSVLGQTWQDFEIIVADNASTDNSCEVVRSFDDPRIRLFVNRCNVGFAPNLDKATAPARGEYLLLLSSDDLMKPDALADYARVIDDFDGRRHPLVIMAACDVIDGAGKPIGRKTAQTGDVRVALGRGGAAGSVANAPAIERHDSRMILRALLTGTFQPAGQFLTTCYSRVLYEAVEGYESIMSSIPDSQFCHKILFEGPEVIYLNRSLFAYRVHEANNLHQHLTGGNIKHLTDNYILTQLYGEDQLRRIGLSRTTLQRTFIRNICLEIAFFALLRGQGKKCAQYFHFALAAYPAVAWREPICYAVWAGRPLAPLFWLAYSLSRKLRKQAV